MKRTMRVLLLVWIGFFVSEPGHAQDGKLIEQIRLSGAYTGGMKLNDPVTGANGLGFRIEGRFALYRNLSMSLHAGYSYLHIRQPDPITWWEWDYWEIYYSTYLEVWTQEGIYGYEISPQQRVELFPISVTFNYALPRLADRLAWSLSLGGGVFIFENRLFTNEYWWKEFPAIDFVYEYRFTNHAPSKHGAVYGIVTGLDLTYRISRVFGITVSTHYNHLISSIRKNDFELFPYGSSLNVSTGMIFYY